MASANQLIKSIQRKESFLQVSSAIHGEERLSRLIITQPKQEEDDFRDSEESKSSEELVDAPELPVAAPAPARPSGVGVVAPAARRVSNAGAGAALVPGARRTSTAGGKRNSRVSPMPISLAAGGGLEAGKAAAEVAAAEPTNGGGSEAAPLPSASTQGAPEAAGAAAGTAAAGAPEVALASGAAPAAAAAPAATAASGPEPSAKPLSRWGKLRVAAVSATRLRQANEKIRVYGTKKARDESEDDSDVDPEDPRTVQERKAAAEARWYIVLPDSWFKRWWETVVLVTLIYVIVIVPVRVGFDIEVTGGAATFDMVVDFFFLFDVFLNFFAAYATSTGDLVVDHRLIAMHYIQGWFTLDLLASIPFYMFETTTNEDGTVVVNSNSQLNRFGRIARIPRIFRLVRLLRLLKLLRAFRFIRIFNQWETHNIGIDAGITRMFKIAFIVTMITHLIACGWYMVAWIGFDEVQPSSWVYRHGIQDETVQTKYLTSLYWAFSTLATVGYGDISAKTDLERMFSIVCMLFGVSWYAFVVSTISSILGMFDRRNAEVKRKQSLLTMFMRDTNVPTELRRRILKYFDYVVSVQDHDGAQGEMESVLSLLSAQLRTEVTLHVHRNLIPQIPFFNDKTKQFQSACVARLTPLRFFPGDYISSRGQHADEMYFLVQGRAVVVLPDGTRFRSVVQGSYFGEIGCILSEVHRFSIVAATECEVYALSKNDLKELMADYPDVAAEIRRTARLRIEHINSHPRGMTVFGTEGLGMTTSLPGVAYENVTAEDIRTIDGIAEACSENDDEQAIEDRDSSYSELDETALSDSRRAPATVWGAQPGQEHGGQVQSGYGQPQALSGGHAELGGPVGAAQGLDGAGANRADIGRLLAENRELRSTMDAMRASLQDIHKLLHTVHAVTLTRADPLASSKDLKQIIETSAAIHPATHPAAIQLVRLPSQSK